MVGGIGRRGDTWLDKIATRKVVGFLHSDLLRTSSLLAGVRPAWIAVSINYGQRSFASGSAARKVS